MSTRRPRPPRPRTPHVEPLESRLALTAAAVVAAGPPIAEVAPPADATLGVSLAEPADGSAGPAPAAVVLCFDGPLDPDTLDPGGELILVALDPDGAPLATMPLGPGVLDPSGTLLAVPLAGPLAPGPYAVQFAPGARLAGLDGRRAAPADGEARPLGQFAVTDGWGAEPPQQGPLLPVALAEPADGSAGPAPAAVVLRFDGPLDPDTLDPGGELILVALDPDGAPLAWTPLGPSAIGADGSLLVVTLAEPLAPGAYAVLLAPGVHLAGLDGRPAATADGEPRLVGQFTVLAPRGPRLDAATDLGTPPAGAVVAVAGRLDLAAEPNAVALYRITLPAGAPWRLGLEVSAQRDGGTLDAALALFDAAGRPIAVAEYGRPAFPNDPFLFAGLAPGVYYVGVSGARDLPGRPGGYDPAAGTSGSTRPDQEGGPFTLHLVADRVAGPVQVTSFALDRDRPGAGATPIGFTLGFSGTIRRDGADGGLFAGLDDAVAVVDAAGRAWPVLALRYDEATARLTYLFREALPEGAYAVLLPPAGGLVDLAGLAPIAPGEPAGRLGTFTIPAAEPDPEPDPTRLGPLMPDGALAGVTLRATVPPGEATTCTVTITLPGLYRFRARYEGGAPRIELTGAGVRLAIRPAATAAEDAEARTFLAAGQYRLTLAAPEGLPAQVEVSFGLPGIPDLIAPNGVGQEPALTLRLVAPPIPAPPGAPGPGATEPSPFVPPASPVVPPITSGGAGRSGPGRPALSWRLAGPSSVPGLGDDFRGRPAPPPRAAGPAAVATATATADATGAGVGQCAPPAATGPEGAALPAPAVPVEAPADPAATASAPTAEAEPEPDAEPVGLVTLVARDGLRRAGAWLGGLDEALAGWLGVGVEAAGEGVAMEALGAGGVVLPEADIPPIQVEVEGAWSGLEAGVPLAVGLLTVLVAWARRRRRARRDAVASGRRDDGSRSRPAAAG